MGAMWTWFSWGRSDNSEENNIKKIIFVTIFLYLHNHILTLHNIVYYTDLHLSASPPIMK